jgi:hypothetical protein
MCTPWEEDALQRAHLLRQIIRPSHGYWLSFAGGLPFYSDIGHRIFSRD